MMLRKIKCFLGFHDFRSYNKTINNLLIKKTKQAEELIKKDLNTCIVSDEIKLGNLIYKLDIYPSKYNFKEYKSTISTKIKDNKQICVWCNKIRYKEPTL